MGRRDPSATPPRLVGCAEALALFAELHDVDNAVHVGEPLAPRRTMKRSARKLTAQSSVRYRGRNVCACRTRSTNASSASTAVSAMSAAASRRLRVLRRDSCTGDGGAMTVASAAAAAAGPPTTGDVSPTFGLFALFLFRLPGTHSDCGAVVVMVVVDCERDSGSRHGDGLTPPGLVVAGQGSM